MGVEYYLANNKNKTLFELGKNWWWFVCDDFRAKDDLEKYLYLETTQKYIFDTYKQEYFETKEMPEDTVKYVKWVATKIFEFIDGFDLEKDISVANDCDDSRFELEEKGYILIGSRYLMNSAKEYNEYIIEQNISAARYHKNIKVDREMLKLLTPDFSLKRFNSLLIFT